MLKLFISLIFLQTVIFFEPIFARFSNNSMQYRSSDGFSGTADALGRQFPIDASFTTFLLPHLIVGVFIPIAVIIGIGVVLMKLFIIGFWLLGKGGYGFGQNLGPYPWRVDGSPIQQQHIQRSLLGRDGTIIPSYLSSTLWNLMEKFSNSLEKQQKYKN